MGVETRKDSSTWIFPQLYEFLNAKILGDNVAVVTLVFLLCVGVSWLLLARLRPGRQSLRHRRQ
jgi:ribose/xylose/arabinose/galactoside ABC-type transport system permease subunit